MQCTEETLYQLHDEVRKSAVRVLFLVDSVVLSGLLRFRVIFEIILVKLFATSLLYKIDRDRPNTCKGFDSNADTKLTLSEDRGLLFHILLLQYKHCVILQTLISV
jgi:hypothetical protein